MCPCRNGERDVPEKKADRAFCVFPSPDSIPESIISTVKKGTVGRTFPALKMARWKPHEGGKGCVAPLKSPTFLPPMGITPIFAGLSPCPSLLSSSFLPAFSRPSPCTPVSVSQAPPFLPLHRFSDSQKSPQAPGSFGTPASTSFISLHPWISKVSD